MYFKVLKHKQFKDVYGVIEGATGIYQSRVPRLFPMTSSLEAMRGYLVDHGQNIVAAQLVWYDMVVVEVKEQVFLCASHTEGGGACAYQCETCRNQQDPKSYTPRHGEDMH